MKTKPTIIVSLALFLVVLTGCASTSPAGKANNHSSTIYSSVSSPEASPQSSKLLNEPSGKTTTASPSPSIIIPPTPPAKAKSTVSTPADPIAGRVFHTLPAIINIPPVAPACAIMPSGSVATVSAPDGDGNVTGTMTADLQSFANQYNSIRVANCLVPIAYTNFHYSACLQARVEWMADDPSENPANTWGHTGTPSLAPNPVTGILYTTSNPIVGCDGDLAGGNGYTGATAAQAWWDSPDHRVSLYQPSGIVTPTVCIYFAISHGGVPDEPSSFARVAAYWDKC
jgi:hypothetical protein